MNPIPKFALRCIVTFTLLFGLVATSFAQSEAEQAEKARAEARKQMREQQRKMRESKTMQQMQKQIAKNLTKNLWNGKGTQMYMGLANDPDTRKGLGITDEQHAALNQSMGMGGDDPKMQEFMKKMNDFRAYQNPEDPFLDNAPEEKRREFVQLQGDMMEYMLEKQTAAIDKAITPEQKRKFQEIQIATMGDFPIVAPAMFEALDLNDEQRKQLDTIKKELEPDFEKNMNRMMDAQMKIMNKIGEYQDREDVDVDWTKPEEAAKSLEEIQKKVLAENPDLQKEIGEMLDEGSAFTNRLKFQMFDVLTDQQMDRMSELINNPPDYVKKIRDKMRAQTSAMRGSPSGGLDINVWKPGDPIPAEYIQKRKSGRFPGK